MGSKWMYNGIASKMVFELGLHKKFENVQMSREINQIRNEAFWMTFVSEK